ncbi:cystatin-S-like [Psammomys obesus]|uniref:cystatin-S-like n=1 Tax=Psammomys obesus TaxID=48139 RepID=UPI002452C8CD|nr:cystatin-S-like [Psammomys obesus]
MACLLHAQTLLLTTLMVVLNLNLNAVLGQLFSDTHNVSRKKKGVTEMLSFAVNKYNEKYSDLYLSHVVETVFIRKTVGAEIYFFGVILAQTTCMKSQYDLTNCPFNEEADQKKITSNDVHSRLDC